MQDRDRIGWIPRYSVNLKNFKSACQCVDWKPIVVEIMNRESTDGQKPAHESKLKELKDNCKERNIGCKHISTIEGSGMLIRLENYFASFVRDDISVPKMPYFDWLEEKIRNELLNTNDGEKVYFFFHSIDRLIRPVGYDRKKTNTWDITNADLEIFESWLYHCFGERTQDIVFLILHDETPEIIRRIQTAAGMQQRGKKGGRPRKQSTDTQIKAKKCEPGYKKKILLEFLPIVIQLGSDGMGSKQIASYLKSHQQVTIPDKTIRNWIKKHGTPKRRGRPSKTQI